VISFKRPAVNYFAPFLSDRSKLEIRAAGSDAGFFLELPNGSIQKRLSVRRFSLGNCPVSIVLRLI
jgi:hypothetical protein